MFISRLRRKTQIRRRKGERETLVEDAIRFQDIVVSKAQERGLSVPNKLLRELQRGAEQRDGGKRLYKLDLRRAHLMDAHVEVLTAALQELPVVRKLDLRGNGGVTLQALNALNSLLKGQLELFRLLQADASMADSSLSFMYSVKMDASVLSLDRAAAQELEAQAAALGIADSVLDVRHAFFEADIRESGTLTEHELSEAMRTVMGTTPKPGETSRVLRFFGEPGTNAKGPTVISIGGFEAAMVGRMRESRTLPMLPQGRDDLLFGSAGGNDDQENSERFSPWSTRSFGNTTGGIGVRKTVGGNGAGSTVVGRRSPLSTHRDLKSPAGMGTYARPLPTWSGLDGGSDVDDIQRSAAVSDAKPGGNHDLYSVFGDGEDNNDNASVDEAGNDHRPATATPKRLEDAGREVVASRGSGSNSSEKHKDRRRSSSSTCTSTSTSKLSNDKPVEEIKDRGIGRNKGLNNGPTPARKSRYSSISAGSRGSKDGVGEEYVLSDCSSDEDASLSGSSPRNQGKGVGVAGSKFQFEHAGFSREQCGGNRSPKSIAAGSMDCRRHSAAPSLTAKGRGMTVKTTGTGSGGCGGGEGNVMVRRVSDVPPSSLPVGDYYRTQGGRSALAYPFANRRQSLWNEDTGDSESDPQDSSADQVGPHATISPSVQQRGYGPPFEQSASPRSNGSMSHQTTASTRTDAPSKEDMFVPLDGSTVPPTMPCKAKDLGAGDARPAMPPSPTLHMAVDTIATGQNCHNPFPGEFSRTEGAPGTGGCSASNFPGGTTTASTSRGDAREGEDVEEERQTRMPKLSEDAERNGDESPSVALSVSAVGGGAAPSGPLLAANKRGEEEPESTTTAATRKGRSVEDVGVSPLVSSPSSLEQRPGITVRVGQSVGGDAREQSNVPDELDVSNLDSVTPHPRPTARLVQAAPGATTQNLSNNREGAVADTNIDVFGGKSGAVGSSLESITEVPGGEGSDSYSGSARSIASPVAASTAATAAVTAAAAASTLDVECDDGTLRKPYCLSPTNILRQARGTNSVAATSPSCRQRELLAARIQISVDKNLAAAAAAAVTTSAHVAQKGSPNGQLQLNTSITESAFDNCLTMDGSGSAAGLTSATGSPGFHTDAKYNLLQSEGGGSTSPSLSRHGGGTRIASGDVAGEDDAFASQSQPSPSRFHFPSSETKTVPLCGAGGASSLFQGVSLTNDCTATSRGGGEQRGLFSRITSEAASPGCVEGGAVAKEAIVRGEVKESRGSSSPAGFLQLDEEQLALRLSEGALVISRSGLAKMGVVLELEAVCGCGRDSLLGLHTLTLSFNQLQVLDISVLATMPALRHMDVSHNLLCRMEPMDGRDLPPRLETLNMSHNRISRIGGIGQCSHLRVLVLHHNDIKCIQGLEHLSLLEQLDLRHNQISKEASARALSFNRSLKLLWLEGNPLASHPRYRPTLTCLLPHVRAIDSRGMPPSPDSEQRRWATACDGFDNERFNGTSAAIAGGDRAKGVGKGGSGPGTSGNPSVSREWQARQDERRSKDWRQIMERRKDQARRVEESQGLASRRRNDARHSINAAQQKRQADELARPRARTRPTEETINKAKEVASRRPAVVFGMSYRGEKDYYKGIANSTSDSNIAGAHVNTANTTVSIGGQEQQEESLLRETPSIDEDKQCGGIGDADGRVEGWCGGGNFGVPRGTAMNDGEARVAQILTCEEKLMSGRHHELHEKWPQQVYESGGDIESSLASSNPRRGGSSAVNEKNYRDDIMSLLSTATALDRKHVSKSITDRQRNNLVEGWLLDVKLETETAGTALRVLMKMCEERGRRVDEQRRLSSFRNALEGMGLFSTQHGPVPATFGDDEESRVLAHKVSVAARKVAMTKAAVKNMLRLMENAEPGEDGSAELEQYAAFIRQQGEIVIGADDSQRSTESFSRVMRKGATEIAAETSKAQHDNAPAAGSTDHQRPIAPSDTAVAISTRASSSALLATTAASTEFPASDSITPAATTSTTNVADTKDTADTWMDGAKQLTLELNASCNTRSTTPLLHPTRASTLGATTDGAARPESDTPSIDHATAETSRTEKNLEVESTISEAVGVTADSAVSPLPKVSKDAGEAESDSLAHESSADTYTAVSLTTAIDDPRRNSGNVQKSAGPGEDGEHREEAKLLPSSSHVSPLSDIVASTPSPPPLPTDGELGSTCLQPKNTIVSPGVAASDGDDIGATADNALDTQKGEGQEELKTSRTPLPPESVVSTAVGVATGVKLSVRERLLRHVKTTNATRSGSDDDVYSISCSSGVADGDGDCTDTNEGDPDDRDRGTATEIITEVAQPEQCIIPAQDDNREEGGITGETAEGGESNGDDSAVVAVAGELGEGDGETRSSAKESLEATPYPHRHEIGGGGHNSGDDHNVPPSQSDSASLTSSAPRSSIGTPLGDYGVPAVAHNDRGPIRPDELCAGFTTTLEAADVENDDSIATGVGGGDDGTGVAQGQSNDTPSHDADGDVLPHASPEPACDGVIVHDVESSANLDNPDKAVQPTMKDKREDTPNSLPASAINAASPRVDETKNQGGNNGSPTPATPATATGTEAGSAPGQPKEDEPNRSLLTAANGKENEETVAEKAGRDIVDPEREEDNPAKVARDGDIDRREDGSDGENNPDGPIVTELDWIEGYDPGHDCYYYHHVPTGESRWYKPDEPYEPYVHSDEEQEENEMLQAPESDEDQRRERKGHGINNADNRHRRKKRDGFQEEDESTREPSSKRRESSKDESTREPSSKRRESSKEARKRSSKSSMTSVGSQRRRRDGDGDNGKCASHSPSSGSPSLDGAGSVERRLRGEREESGRQRQRQSERSSRQQRGKTALERLYDLTDENVDVSSDLESDYGGGGSRKPAGSGRRDSRGSRRRNDDDDDAHHGSSRRHKNGDGGGDGSKRRGKARRNSSPKRREHNDDYDNTRRRSSQRSSSSRHRRGRYSSGESNSEGVNDESFRRESSSARRSKRDRGGSESHRSIKYTRDSRRGS